ncbi:MAG TPA: ABC transporter ATP-binding protein [Pyrinomonadaceae bacterium]|jgi:ABC-type multidrug transport system fused ATPase/permease subunit|nr:ABC transporter ATP-binding protein [Pyrinomonadaceae bacterium]
MSADQQQQKQHVWRKLGRVFGPDLWTHRRLLLSSYAFRLISVGALIFAPWPLKIIIDNVITSRPLPGALRPLGASLSPEALVLWMTVLFVAATVVGAITNALEKNLSARVRERLTLALRDRLLAHLQTLPPTFRTRQRSGELVLRLVDDSDLFVRVLTKTLPVLFQQISTVILILVVMLWLDLRLAAFAMCLVPVLFVVIRHYSARLWRASRDKRKQEGKVSGLAQEIIRGLPVIQALGGEGHTRRRFERVNRKRLRSGVEETRIAVRMEQTMQIIQGFALALTTCVGALLILRRQLTLGELTVFTAYVAQLLKPIEKLNDLSETAGRGFAGGERLLSLLEHRPLVVDAPDVIDIGRARGVIEFRDVWFEYPDADSRTEFVLRGVNMRLEPGRLSVLMGQSGAGKSTIMSLMVRLFDPTSGEITLDGRPLRELSVRSLRSQIAIMTQDTHLFSGSLQRALIPDGVAVKEAKIWEALSLVALDDFVRRLPEKLLTRLGEDALNLSGGQRQRLSLARAFLMDRPILLLDEPLANVDAASAIVILKALDHLRTTRTCLAITHQSQLLDYADVVYRLDAGRTTEEELAGVGQGGPMGPLSNVRRLAR